MSTPYRLWEIQQRSNTGPQCDEEDFLPKIFTPKLQEIVKKYEITYDPQTPVPGDDNLADRVWQAGTMLLPVQSVGVMGDERTYEYVVALRAVTATDGMTADWAHLPDSFLSKISNEIINKVRGINRVVYDISSKPPATIEWE